MSKKSMSKKIIKALTLILLFSFSLSFPLLFPGTVNAAGASLFLSPASGSYNTGGSFSVNVMVNSGGGVGINAAEATISFNKEYLNVKSVSQSGSILELWTSKPAFSNKDGRVTFGGGMTEAYKGSAGKLFSITFSALKAGTTKVSFSGAVVTAHDGQGTNIFSGAGSGSYTIADKTEPKKEEAPKKAEVKEETKPAEKKEISSGILPPAPEVSSASHPEDGRWYSKNSAVLSWKLLADITGVSLILTESATSDPGPKADGVIENKNYDKLTDGEHYFHVKLQNKNGWGPITHRKILVDTAPPAEVKLEIDNGGDATNPSPFLKFSSSDKTSGIEKYKIAFNNEEKEIVPRDFYAEPHQLGKLSPGSYEVTVKAYDKAENMASSSIAFVVDPLRAPTITEIPKVLQKGEDLIVRGTSFYPDATVSVFMSLEGADPTKNEVKTDENGDWSYFHKERLSKGNYQIWTKITNAAGAESLGSTKQLLYVVSPGIIVSYGPYIIIFLILIIIVLALYILYLKKKFGDEREKIKVETLEASKKIREVFLALEEEVDELMVYADKRAGLSESERRIKEKIREALDISEEFLTKEVEDIEKEIKTAKIKKKK